MPGSNDITINNDGGTTVQDRPDTKSKPTLKRPKKYAVFILNDDFTPMGFVVDLLIHIFGKTPEEAEVVMMEVHQKGRAVAGVYTFEVAETKMGQGNVLAKQAQHPLQLVMEKH